MLRGMILTTGLLALGLLFGFDTRQAEAMPISYGNFVSPTITFQDVTESTQTPGDPSPLFGAPSFTVLPGGDARLSFSPTQFSSSASNSAIDLTDGLLKFTMVAPNALSSINSISITESGGFTLAGAQTSTSGVQASIIGFVQIEEIAGIPVASPIVIPLVSTPFTQTGPLPPGSPLGLNGGWSLTASASLAAYPNVTKAMFSMDNQLLSISNPNSLSFIDKKLFSITTDGTFVIPEPSTIMGWVVGICAIGAAFHQRKTIKMMICAMF